MVNFSPLFAVAAGLLVSPATGLSVETRQLPPTVSQIISSITSFGLVKDINVFITAQSLIDNTFSLNFDVQNLLPIEITIDSLSTDAGLNGEVFETISHTFASPGLVVPPLGTANSGNIANVPLPQGALAAIGIISNEKLDLSNLAASIRAITISGSGGISIPLSGLSQSGVTTTYTPNIAQFASTLASSALIQDINIFITPQSLVDNTVSLNFDIHNPLPVELTIDQLGTNAGLDGTTYATFSHSFASPGLVIPASGSINSGTIDNVALLQGALATLGIIPSGKLDLSSFSASTRDLTLNGAGGIPVPLSDLSQSSVPTTYTPNPADLANTLGTVGLVQSITIIFSLQTLSRSTSSQPMVGLTARLT
ncbi:hypothetical protein BDN70DRAFT_453537 [Pholiota conissans]|uniref:Uncharacterized protein n=1 Tax=Pholiota conissans TaxID=109636 RepID=A0A9P5YP98_9AGAR|nr:hypothetical protein BDN70DRAFT_453537 [Pholiota conissans]